MLLEHVSARWRAEFDPGERLELFDQLKPHLWGEDDATPYAELATRFNLSESAIKVDNPVFDQLNRPLQWHLLRRAGKSDRHCRQNSRRPTPPRGELPRRSVHG